MANHSFRYYSELKVTFLNDSVYRSKRPFEGSEEGSEPNAKRQHLSKLCGKPFLVASAPPSSSTGVPPVRSVTISDRSDGSDLDDSLLELSDGESEGSLSELTQEDEDKLLYGSDSDLETSGSKAFIANVQLARVQSVTVTVVAPNGPPDCAREDDAFRKDPQNPESDVNTSSLSQAGLGLSSDCSAIAEGTPVARSLLGLQKAGDAPGIRGEPAQTVSSSSWATSLLATGNHAEERIPANKTELVSETGSNPPCRTAREPASSDTHLKSPPPASNSASDQREAHVGDASGAERNRPPVPNSSSVRPRTRININESELEIDKEKYIQAVLAHARGSEHILGEVKEVHALMWKVHHESRSQDPRPRHPTDLTKRNYKQRNDKAKNKLTLHQWFDKCGPNYCRFENIPSHFKRSPVPN